MQLYWLYSDNRRVKMTLGREEFLRQFFQFLTFRLHTPSSHVRNERTNAPSAVHSLALLSHLLGGQYFCHLCGGGSRGRSPVQASVGTPGEWKVDREESQKEVWRAELLARLTLLDRMIYEQGVAPAIVRERGKTRRRTTSGRKVSR